MKMIKILVPIFILLSFTVASCAPETLTTDVSATQLSGTILDEYTFPAMYEVPTDELLAEFGISDKHFSEVSAYTTEEPYGIERVFFAIVKDGESIENAKTELTAYFDMIKGQSANYDPVEFAKAENASVYSNGNLLALVICEDSDGALNKVKELIK